MVLLKFRGKKNVFIFGFCLLMFSCLLGCNKTIVKNTNFGEALGTTYSITYLSDAELDFQKEIDSVFAVVNKSMSTYIPNSDISRINKGDTTVVVDHMFKEVFELSNRIYSSTDRYFDPTVGTLVNAWGFGPEERIKLDSVAVDSLLQYVGFDKVKLNDDNTIIKTTPNIYFDFNAIAKGYALDRLAQMLSNKGIFNYLVELGGEIVVKGQNINKNKPWAIGVDDPQATDRSNPKIILGLSDVALASSGNYRKFRVDSITEKKYVHTINPKTGYTKNSNILGTTVIAQSCAEADAYATAFMVMELNESIGLLASQKEGLEAYIIYLDKSGVTKEFMTKGFQELVLE